jgi:hypothetical protein
VTTADEEEIVTDDGEDSENQTPNSSESSVEKVFLNRI